MEEKAIVAIYLLPMIISMPIGLGVIVCCILWYEKKLAQEDQDGQVVQGHDGGY